MRGSIEKMAESLVNKSLTPREFILEFCEICRTARAKGLLCNMHGALDPTFDVEKCQACMPHGAEMSNLKFLKTE